MEHLPIVCDDSPWRNGLTERDFNLRKTARHGSIHGGNDTVQVLSDKPPWRLPENHYRYSSTRQVLLIADILVGR